jgi:tRNA-dihydrouridine synthase A
MIGAILMKHPHIVADSVKAMRDNCSIDVTVKNRIGVDDMEDYSGLRDFVGTVSEAGATTFIVHARKAWLKGLSPKQNREIPPLNYELVYRLKCEFPALEIIINGGIASMNDIKTHLEHVEGVMLGREAYQNPIFLQTVESELFQFDNHLTRREILEKFLLYVETEVNNGVNLNHMTRHILGLYHGIPGGKVFRRFLSERAHLKTSTPQLILDAADAAEHAAKAPRAK